MLTASFEALRTFLTVMAIAVAIPLSPAFLAIELIIETTAWVAALPFGGIPFGSFTLNAA